MRRITKAVLAPAAAVSLAVALAGLAAGPAAATTYPPPSIHLLCTAAPTSGALHGSVCALASGQTTAPNAYSATVAVGTRGRAGPNVTFTVTAGSLPPGLTMSASSGTSTAITGNPTQAGTFNFTIKATDGGLTSTQAYQITVTVQGPPDQLVCTPAVNGGFLISGACVLPDAVLGQPYQGHLPTSHNAGGTLSIVAGALPAGLSLPATFGPSGDIVGGTPTQPLGDYNTYNFTVQGTGDQGQPLYQAYQITVDPNQPLTIVLPAGGPGGSSSPILFPAPVDQAYAQDFFVSGGAAPYTWAVTAGQLPPGLTLQTDAAGPRDANDELAGTPTTAGTYTFTMQVSDFNGQQATQQFSLTIYPPLQVTTTMLAAGTVGVTYSHGLMAQGGAPPYSWSMDTGQLPPGLTFSTSGTPPTSNGVLSGTPTKAGTFSFSMEVEDSQGNTASGTVTITINP